MRVTSLQTRRRSRIGNVITSAPMAFTRASSATVDGQTVGNDTPRFPSNSGTKGLMIEELTGNKITTTPGSGTLFNPGDTAGWAKTGDAASTFAVVTDDTETAALGFPSGTNVYRLDNSAGTTEALVTASGTNGNTNKHSVSAYVRGTGTAEVLLTSVGNLGLAALTSVYVRRKAENLTPISNFGQVRVRAAAGAVVYFCLPQMEEKAYCTSPQIGNRASETATVPTDGLLEPQAGSVSIDYFLTAAQVADSITRSLVQVSEGGIGAYNNRVVLRLNGATIYGATRNTVTGTTATANKATLVAGLNRAVLVWSAAELAVFSNGVKVASWPNPVLPVSFANTLICIGFDRVDGTQCNIPIMAVRTYTDALTGPEAVATSLGNPAPQFTAYLDFTQGQLRVRLGHPWRTAELINLLLDRR